MSNYYRYNNSAITHASTDLANTQRDLVSGMELQYPEYLPRRWVEGMCASFSTAQNIVSALPMASLAKGIHITGNLDPELKKAAQEVIFDQNPVELPGRPNLNASKYLRHAAIAAERIGGAALFLDIDDGQEPDQPVKIDKIKSIRGIRFFDGFDVYPDWESLGFYSGEVEPEYYRFLQAAWVNQPRDRWDGRVHRSRVCPIHGRRIMGKEIAYCFNLGWLSDSSLRPAIRSILRLELVLQANANKAARSGIPVFKVADMIKNITQDARSNTGFRTNHNNYQNLSYTERLKQRVEDFAQHYSVYHVFTIDKEREDLELKEFSFQGIPEMIEKQENALIMDTGLPAWKIYGQLKKSLGTQNEGEAREWEAQVNEYRNGDLRSAIVKILTYWMLSKENQYTKGKLPDNWGLEFLPVWEQSGMDKAKENQQEAQVVRTMQQVGQLASNQQANGQQPVYTVEELRDWLREQDSSPGFDITLAESDSKQENQDSDDRLTPSTIKEICPYDRRALAQEIARKNKANENHSLELSTLQLMQQDSWGEEEQEKAKLVYQGWVNNKE